MVPVDIAVCVAVFHRSSPSLEVKLRCGELVGWLTDQTSCLGASAPMLTAVFGAH